jgi:hypothetical protein
MAGSSFAAVALATAELGVSFPPRFRLFPGPMEPFQLLTFSDERKF